MNPVPRKTNSWRADSPCLMLVMVLWKCLCFVSQIVFKHVLHMPQISSNGHCSRRTLTALEMDNKRNPPRQSSHCVFSGELLMPRWRERNLGRVDRSDEMAHDIVGLVKPDGLGLKRRWLCKGRRLRENIAFLSMHTRIFSSTVVSVDNFCFQLLSHIY
jgi:hypothetical protein